MMGFLLYIISLVVINCESEIVLDYVYGDWGLGIGDWAQSPIPI